ncbi:short-chain dehydrogenase [Nautilia profundicola AmH]|uniref:Short-chain dehydrogenase n=1 Tax=Nautilia profundicola (strain ATCC BAA-1463 / DSM 18972 / AmH) TaxID=598659 RepID=B9L8I7_NAUPA|nr:SDR family NAD(P)-dependent oxidoreductase [Nautilia profundicola]ACM92866.1 short-chain dehydrogenase [Nautilia profundicola AmH]
MKILLTGASSGIGKAIKETLRDYEIITLCRNCDEKIDFNNINVLKNLKIDDVYGIIHNSGIGYFGQFEDIGTDKIQEMINVNFLAPMILTKNHLKDIKKNRGFIINISSTSAIHPARQGVVYGATKAALRHFGTSLFEEVRKSGVKVCTILPDMTLTNFHKNTYFKPSSDELAHIKPEDIAKIVKDIIEAPKNIVMHEVVIKPQIFKLDKK